MLPTARRLLSASASVAKVNKSARSLVRNPLDLQSMSADFDFPLARPALLAIEKRRIFLRYLRLEQFQFVELAQLGRTFKKPRPTQVLKLRTQHYQGEAHPASRKVVLTAAIGSLPLSSPAALHKFKLIAGPRWDSSKDELKISCELFPVGSMNEKWCSDTLDKMIAAAEDMTDPMADIPLDTRATDARLRKSGAKRIVTLRDFPSEWLSAAAPAPVAAAEEVGQFEEFITESEVEADLAEQLGEAQLEDQPQEEGEAPVVAW